MKTSELTGTALDWAVAKCEGNPTSVQYWHKYVYSTDWAQAGPIIERERIGIDPSPDSSEWQAYQDAYGFFGPTPLIAAMRCYVASKLGNEVDIPEGLK